MKMYYLVPSFELSQDILASSISNDVSKIPTKVYSGITYYILEVQDSSTPAALRPYARCFAHQLDTVVPFIPSQKARVTGIFKESPPANATTEYVYALPENRIIKGLALYCASTTFGDYIEVKSTTSADVVIGNSIKNFYVSDGHLKIDLPRILILATTKIKISYTNTNALIVAKFYVNMHWDTE